MGVNKSDSKIYWPKINKNVLVKDKINFVVQINGKTRGVLNLKTGINEKELIKKINEDQKIKNHIKDKTIKKTIFIPDKLINMII